MPSQTSNSACSTHKFYSRLKKNDGCWECVAGFDRHPFQHCECKSETFHHHGSFLQEIRIRITHELERTRR